MTAGRHVAALAAFLFACAPACAIAQQANYDQRYRPQAHFSPARKWTNDPNGLVYYKGVYNLFFQYNPFGDTWGHMSWGHAVSRDLLHWKQLPVAIPEQDGVMIFTGSVVIDRHDTSGLCGPQKECLVAVYTGNSNTPGGQRQTQNLAYSRDGGRTWTKYGHNPVLDLHRANFRDPSVSWDEARHRWLMAVSLPREHKISFYHSRDLKHWVHTSDFGPSGDIRGQWECPDLVRVPFLNGKGWKWVLKVGLNPGAPQGGSGEQYFVGNFDGDSFHASKQPGAHGWTNYGKDDYCAISFNGIPSADPPILLGWMDNWQYAEKLPTSPWRGQMSLPRKLYLIRDGAGLGLVQQPIVAALRTAAVPIPRSAISGDEQTIATLSPPYELDLSGVNAAAKNFGVRIYTDRQHWTTIGFDLEKQEFYIDRTKSDAVAIPGFSARTTAPLVRGRSDKVELIVDRSSVEAYTQDGTIAMTDLIYPPALSNSVALFSSGPLGAERVVHIWKIASIWPEAGPQGKSAGK